MTQALTPEFLRVCSGQRRGSLMVGYPAKGLKAPKETALHQYDGHVNLQSLLQNVNNWDFDVFSLSSLAKGRPLFYLGLHLFAQQELIKTFNLEIMKLVKFLSLTEEAYHSENPYHNSLHACDVLQALHTLYQEQKISSSITPLEMLASLLAAILHDVDHPGVNQSFLINTSSYLTFIHGNRSLLEYHHICSAHAIIAQSHILDHLPVEEHKEVLTLMDSLILATDFTQHKSYVEMFSKKMQCGLDLTDSEDRLFVLKMAMKCADISNQTRQWNVCQSWSKRIIEEFFRQGDYERNLHIPISFMCDRYTVKMPESQKGFIVFMALPLFELWNRLMMSPQSKHILQNLHGNQAHWEKMME